MIVTALRCGTEPGLQAVWHFFLRRGEHSARRALRLEPRSFPVHVAKAGVAFEQGARERFVTPPLTVWTERRRTLPTAC